MNIRIIRNVFKNFKDFKYLCIYKGKYQKGCIATQYTYYMFILPQSIFIYIIIIIIIKEKSLLMYKFKRLIYTIKTYKSTKKRASYYFVTQSTYVCNI